MPEVRRLRPYLEPILVLVLALALLAGCTARQSHEQYEKDLGAALSARSQVIRQIDAGSLETAAQYEEAARTVNEALERFDAEPPPKDVQQAHEQMVAGLEGLAALADRLGRCERLAKDTSERDARACRQAIGQSVYDEIRNDFGEANTIYLEEGFSLPGLGAEDEAGDSLDGNPEGGDEL